VKLPSLGEVRKAVAALSAGVVVMVAAGLITGSVQAWIVGALAAVGAGLATYAVPANTPKP
jgi:hypothetical protein